MTAYFEATDAGLVPAPEARSPWSAEMLHGRLLSGLAARAIEQHTSDAFRVARLTVDLFRSPPMEPLQVTADVVRDGRRVRALDVSMSSAGAVVARASAILLHLGEHPDDPVWVAPEWEVPAPDEVAPRGAVGPWGGWDIRMISEGGFGGTGQKRLWTRDTWELVRGEALTPVVRAALAADLPNPLANSGAAGLQFINADLTMLLRRAPRTEWIGLEVLGHLGQDGIAVGSCTMYDTDGAIGWSSVCAVASPAAMRA